MKLPSGEASRRRSTPLPHPPRSDCRVRLLERAHSLVQYLVSFSSVGRLTHTSRGLHNILPSSRQAMRSMLCWRSAWSDGSQHTKTLETPPIQLLMTLRRGFDAEYVLAIFCDNTDFEARFAEILVDYKNCRTRKNKESLSDSGFWSYVSQNTRMISHHAHYHDP